MSVVRVLRVPCCAIDGCERPVLARGWCSMHWQRWYRQGDPLVVGRGDDPATRFWAKVDRRGPDECWEWTGARDAGTYSRIGIGGRRVLVHRYAYESEVGPIPDGLVIDHLCRNRGCVNPAHLEPVTLAENTLRGFGTGALNARKTHCKHGHEFTEANTYPRSDGGRGCRACRRESAARRRKT